MADTRTFTLSLRASPTISERSETVLWHQVWLVAVMTTGVALAVALRGLPVPVILALAAGAAPGFLGNGLRWRDASQTRAVLLVFWAVAGAGACALTGGVSGPLGAWCLAPVAAAAALGQGRLHAEGAALALLGAAVVGLAQAAHLIGPPPAGSLAYGLGLLSLGSTAVGLTAGLSLAARRANRRRAADQAAMGALERLLTEQPHLILSLDPDGRVISAFGYAPEGVSEGLLLGEGLLAAADASERPRIEAALQAALSKGQAEVAFSPLGVLHCSTCAHIRRGADGGLVAVLRDVSQERAREAALEAARIDAETLNAGKTRFLANMSHELRTPLNAIMGFSDMMRARLFGPLTGKYSEYVELIHESGQHLLDLINDVLDMSKIEADRYELSLESFDAREPISAALRLMRLQADDAGIALRGALPGRVLEVEADRRALKQIVLNLISNGLKFTPKGGSVTVGVASDETAIEIMVTDTGVGIAEEDLKRLGRPYEQAGDVNQRAKGVGLGLALVRAFAELHGGRMTIESELGEGTSVIVRLPVLKPFPEPGAGPAEERPTAKVIAFSPQR